MDDIIDIEDEENEVYQSERRAVFDPAIRNIVSALGGLEAGQYRMGDECYGCLKDLKKLWRKDDTDDDRTVARIFYEVQVLANDLIPILVATTNADDLEDKRAIAAADLICAMTWPIDLAEELKELDDEEDARADFTQLLRSHLHYKHALLQPGVLQAMITLTLPCLGRDPKAERAQKDRDIQIVHLVLHVIRNLAFIRDPQAGVNASPEAIEMSMMQNRLIQTLSQCHFFDLLLTISANASTNAAFNAWNVTSLEILYLLFRGVRVESVITLTSEKAKTSLRSLLDQEDRQQKGRLLSGSTRHSNFGTTVSVTQRRGKASGAGGDDVDAFGSTSNAPRTLVIHRQRAIKEGAGAVLDNTRGKKSKAVRQKKADEVAGREDNLSAESKKILRNFVGEFLRAGFNSLISSLLKDIKSERAKIAEKDHLRLLFVTKWLMAFFRLSRSSAGKGTLDISFGMLAEVTERGWIAWVLRRMREAVDTKPKAWNELQSGLECLTELILLIEAMSQAAMTSTEDDEAESLAETAQALQEQLIYNGEILELSLESLRAYHEGTQALAYLDAAVHLGYSLLRMLEKWTKGPGGKEMVVQHRAKTKKKKKVTSTEEGEGVVDVDEDEQAAFEEQEREREENIREALFTFEAFELRFANPDVTDTLLAYLARFREYGTNHEKMKYVVGLLHRQAVRAKAEGLFFRASTLDLFKHILAEAKTLPKDQSYKDLLALVNFILRKFFKAVEQEPFLVIETFFPKNRGHWKDYSSLTPEELALKTGKTPKSESVVDRRFPADVQVKKGWNWSEQVGIAILALAEEGHQALVEWSRDLLLVAFSQRQRITEDVDGSSSQQGDLDGNEDVAEEDDAAMEAKQLRRFNGPSQQARAQFSDYVIPYTSDQQADGASRNSQLKLLFRLLDFAILNEDDEATDEVQWCIPKKLVPEQLQRCANIISKYLETPIDLQGKAAKNELSKKARRRRRRRTPSPGLSDEDDDLDFDALLNGRSRDPEEKDRRERRRAEKLARKEAKAAARAQRKKKEEKAYKSRQFIEDSDADQDDEAFWERERQLRLRTEAAANTSLPVGVKASGTKKRKKGADGKTKTRKKKRSGVDDSPPIPEDGNPADSDGGEDDEDARVSAAARSQPASDEEDARPPPRPKARPRPRPVRKSTAATSRATSPASSRQSSVAPSEADDAMDEDTGKSTAAVTKRNKIVISDEED